MKLANALLLLAIIATASALYLGRREQPAATPQQLSTEVVKLRRELAAMKDQIAMLQDDRETQAKPHDEPQASGAESSDD